MSELCVGNKTFVDFSNYSASKQLDWRTPIEKLQGYTPDISAFRFPFWRPVWYYEPTAKFPAPNFLPGRMVGIAWEHGDALSYRIWTTPNDDWEKGRELVRNVVRERHYTDNEPKAVYDDSSIAFEVKRKTQQKITTNGNEKRSLDLEQLGDDTAPPCEKKIRFFSDSQNHGQEDSEESGGKEEMQNNTNDHSKQTNATAPTSNRKRQAATEADEFGIDYDPFDEDIEMTEEVNNELSDDSQATSSVGGARVVEIMKHSWFQGQLKLNVKWDTEELSWETFKDMKEDEPRMTARFLIDNNVTRSKRSDRNLQWARKTLRDVERATRRVARLYNFHLDENDEVYKVRRAQKGSKKKKRLNFNTPVFKYGVQVPQNVRQAVELDNQNGNTFWQDAIKAEVKSLAGLDVFEFKPADYDCGRDYQKTNLRLIFDVKQDLRRKARMVAGGHLVDALEHDLYSSCVKPISVKLLHVIAHKQSLEQLCGDVANAFPNAVTNERVWARAGPEFGSDLEGMVVIIRKALYGLKSSSERWHAHLADTLRTLDFEPTRFDVDVWIRPNADGLTYEYICTHVDDFMIVSKSAQPIMDQLKAIYAIKDIGPPDYYLGNDYKRDKKGRWRIGQKKYLTEALSRVEAMFGILRKYSLPMPSGDHPEMDTSTLLNDDEHRKYQMLVGMLNWITMIGRFDVAHTTSSLARFTSCPRKGHLERALRVFGYLKKRPNRRTCVDSRDPIFEGGEDDFRKDYQEILRSCYPDAAEEIDRDLPKPLVDEMEITVFVDSDHAHDKVTRRSITGIMIFVGRTPVFYSSKRQGAIETSTYSAEFCAMRNATEETIAVRYMLRCLGVKVEHATFMFGDNLGVVQNATIKDSLLKKKHVAIAYHKVRESAAAGIIHPMKINTKDNFSDILTKSLTQRTFDFLVNSIMVNWKR
jgi:hypothetical protein